MGLSEEVEKKLSKHHNEICKALNLDKSSATEAWRNLLQIADSYILEGEPLHWLGCTLYIACKSSFTPTVSKPNVVVQGNLVSLTRLLRIIDLSLIDFFVKMRKCASLLRLSEEFKEHMDKLEKKFSVSMVLFRKFRPIFSDIFRMESSESQKPAHKAKKAKAIPPTCWRVMDFAWTLFICVKANINNITDDLVNSYHLLLACIDYVYANLVVSGRREMIMEGVMSTPENITYSEPSDLPCIVDYLCAKHDGISVDVKAVKEYCLRKWVKKWFDSKVLRGNPVLLTDVIDVSNFDMNMRALGKIYEEFTLSSGGVDERVFLGYSSNMCNIGNFGAYSGGSGQEIGEQLEARRKQNALQGRGGAPLTPLSGKRYLKHPDSLPMAGNSSASLLSNLMSREPGPTAFTKEVMDTCPTTPILEHTVDSLSVLLSDALIQSVEADETITNKRSALKEVRNITDLSAKLFFKFLDSILPGETKKPAFDPNMMLNNEVLIKALFCCAAEVILFSSPKIVTKKFPWILDILNLPSYYCYKVIEVIITYDDMLSRDMVKHLNAVEESILESLAWAASSPLWKALADSGLPVPSCEDVGGESAIEVTEVPAKVAGVDRLTELASRSSVLMNSPGAPLADKFMSPIKGQGKRPHPDEANGPPSKMMAIGKPDGSPRAETSDSSQDVQPSKESRKPKRTGSTSLFFRKFYFLAVVRLLDMCDQLGLSDIDLRRKIWTCFELTVVNHVGLMWNRHLDQLLMCSIYVICKVVGRDPSFMGMMKCYRNQPQAQSHVYRQVLISPDKSLEDIKKDLGKEVRIDEERGDIIRFYNEVFIQKVKELTRKFRTNVDNDRLVLSPILVGKSTPVNGPRRVSEKHPLYLRALLPRSPGSGTPMHYHFSRSPAKDLHAINHMVCKAEPKILKEKPKVKEDASSDHSTNSISKKVKDIYADRISLEQQDMEKQN